MFQESPQLSLGTEFNTNSEFSALLSVRSAFKTALFLPHYTELLDAKFCQWSTEGNCLDKASTRRKSALWRREKVTWQKCIAYGTQMSVAKPSCINLNTSLARLIGFWMTIKKVYATFHLIILPFVKN